MEKLVSVYKSSATPFPAGLVSSCHTASMKESLGLDIAYREFYDIFDRKNGEMFLSPLEIRQVGDVILNRLIHKPQLVQTCKAKYLKNIRHTIKILSPFDLENKLPQLSNKKLKQLLLAAIDSYHKASLFAEQPGYSLELHGQLVVRKWLDEFLRLKNPQIKTHELEACFSTLSTFTNLSFTQKAEQSLLKASLLKDAKLNKALQKHLTRYYWQYHDYHGPVLTMDTLKTEVKAFQKLEKKEIAKRIMKITDSVKENKVKQLHCLKKYCLPKKLLTATKILRNFGSLYSDVKKQYTSEASVGFGKILQFLSQKYRIDALLLHYCTIPEILALVDGRKPDLKILKARTRSCVMVNLNHYPFYLFAEAKEARLIKDRARQDGKFQTVEIKGMAACSGNFIGRAKVVKNASQIAKVKDGDVLIAPFTTVNYVPAMKKAGAIVTDLGGITSHAAIVSRELNIPCVIGTKVATKIFKDGDQIEVNANHGWVRKIN